MKLAIKIIACLLFSCSIAQGQMNEYNYKREILEITEQWHNIVLPDDLFGKVSKDLSDIRIYGLTEKQDTIEAPYLIRVNADKLSNKEVDFKLLNTSYNANGYYFTFDIPAAETINQIQLHFKQTNFDWLVSLEGSFNLNEWFMVADNYRILSIHNANTNFQFSKLVFPDSKYRFVRICIKSNEKPELMRASIARHEIQEGKFKEYATTKFQRNENTKTKQTEIFFELEHAVPICQLKIGIKKQFDYYRPVTIKYITDSIKTDYGWTYNYELLFNGTLNSIEDKALEFDNTIVSKLQIIIDNNDNQPLVIDTILVKGNVYELVARFSEKANYYLTFGNKKAEKPHYDIEQFIEHIPVALTYIKLGNEQLIDQNKSQQILPLFINKMWLWFILIILVTVLGWFSIKMMRPK